MAKPQITIGQLMLITALVAMAVSALVATPDVRLGLVVLALPMAAFFAVLSLWV